MKKLTLLLPLFASLFLVGCGTKTEVTPMAPVVVNQPVEKKVETPKEDNKDLWMIIHMCLMWWGENCDEYLDTANKDIYAELVQEQCDMMPGMEACDVYFGDKEDHPHDWTEADEHHEDEWDDHGHDGNEWEGHDDDSHGDLNSVFEWVTFDTNKELSIDGYDVIIKHKDDIHAGEKITWTITVIKWWDTLDGFEKIDGDDGVWIAKHPDGTVDHLHPLAYTDDSLTFSIGTEELGTYQLITQFKHNWSIVTVPYEIELTAKANDDHGH